MNVWKILLLLGLIHLAYSKGGRGGGSRGSSSYKSSYRGSSSSGGSRFRATNLRTWSTSQKAAALTLGTVYISSRMRTRYGSPDYYKENEVRICKNAEKFSDFNGSTNVYGWFLCPLEKDDNSYCCGSSDKEYCCDFWSSTDAIGAYVGFAFLGVGVIAGIVVLFVCCVYPKLYKKPRPTQSQVMNSTAFSSSQPVAGGNFGENSDPPNYSYIGPASEKNQDFYRQQQYGMYPRQEYQSPPPSYSASGGAPPA